MSTDNTDLILALAELQRDHPQINPVGYSYKEFSQESNNIQQAQSNTIIKLLVKISNKLENLDNRLSNLENTLLNSLSKNKEPISHIELNNSLDNLDKELDILVNKVEKLNFNGQISTPRKVDIKDILGPKVLLKSNGSSKK